MSDLPKPEEYDIGIAVTIGVSAQALAALGYAFLKLKLDEQGAGIHQGIDCLQILGKALSYVGFMLMLASGVLYAFSLGLAPITLAGVLTISIIPFSVLCSRWILKETIHIETWFGTLFICLFLTGAILLSPRHKGTRSSDDLELWTDWPFLLWAVGQICIGVLLAYLYERPDASNMTRKIVPLVHKAQTSALLAIFSRLLVLAFDEGETVRVGIYLPLLVGLSLGVLEPLRLRCLATGTLCVVVPSMITLVSASIILTGGVFFKEYEVYEEHHFWFVLFLLLALCAAVAIIYSEAHYGLTVGVPDGMNRTGVTIQMTSRRAGVKYTQTSPFEITEDDYLVSRAVDV